MTQEDIDKYASEDEKKTMIFTTICFILTLFVYPAIITLPLTIYGLWTYNQIKKAKKIKNEIEMEKINTYPQNNFLSSSANTTKSLKPVCPECNTEYEEGTVFCKKDGEKLILR